MASVPRRSPRHNSTCPIVAPITGAASVQGSDGNHNGPRTLKGPHELVLCRLPVHVLFISVLVLTFLISFAACGSDEGRPMAESDRSESAAPVSRSTPRVTPPLADASPKTDRAALVALYDATGGPNWKDKTNWLTDAPMGEWFGVETDDTGRVLGLVLRRNRLIGELPPALGNLNKLTLLDLGNPSVLGEERHPDENRLSGGIPLNLVACPTWWS